MMFFGGSVGISSDGSTIVAGAPRARVVGSNFDQGAAYVFVNPAGGWISANSPQTETATLTADVIDLGQSVGISSDGSTIVAGAAGATIGSNLGQGAAYVFVMPTAGGWATTSTFTAKLTASDGAAHDEFGGSVGVSSGGSAIVAGAPYAAIGSNSAQGATYFFLIPTTGGWVTTSTYTTKQTASDGAPRALFGSPVGISSDGSTIVAGVPNATIGSNTQQGAAYIIQVTPAATLSASSLSFGSQVMNTTSTPQPVSLTNQGDSLLHITSVAASSGYSTTTACVTASPLAVGASCTESVTFDPGATGSLPGSLTFTDNAGSPQSVTLSGTGTAPVVSVGSSITFSIAQMVDTTSGIQSLTLTNSGTGNLTIAALSITSEFALDPSSTCGSNPTVPAPGSGTNTCTLNVTFSPAGIGTRTGTLILTDNNNGVAGSTQIVTLTGTGTAVVASLSATGLSFGPQLLNTQSGVQSVTLTNTGNSSMTNLSVAIGGANPGDFVKSADTCTGATLAASGGACMVSVTFTPSAIHWRSASLIFTDNASNSPQTVSLGGTGIAPTVLLSTSSLSFGNQTVGAPSNPQVVTLTNTGSAPLAISGIAASGDFAATNNCGSSLAAGGGCIINVTFTPSQGGSRNGTLTITDNNSGVSNSQQTVSLGGVGVNGAASLSATSESFGSQVINTLSSAKTVTLTSTGTANLIISSITMTGANAGDFQETNACPGTLIPTAHCTISLTYTPTVLGPESAAIKIADNAAISPQTVALAGTGEMPVTLSPTSLGFGNVGMNSPSTAKTVTLYNNQSVALSLGTGSITFDNLDYTESDNCNGSVAAKSHCAISITLTPSHTGTDPGTLIIHDAAFGNPQTAGLSGAGVTPAYFSPASLAFGNVPQSTSSTTKNLTLYNNEEKALTITNISTGNTDFTESDTCNEGVPAKGHCVFTITFTPSLIATLETGTFVVTDSASNGSQSATLSGTGIAQASASPDSLAFASQRVGTHSTAKTFTLTNNLSTALSVGTVTFTGNDPGDFSTPPNTCGGSVAAKSKCTISVTFTPGGTGSRSATLNVNDSTNNSPQRVALVGTGR